MGLGLHAATGLVSNGVAAVQLRPIATERELICTCARSPVNPPVVRIFAKGTGTMAPSSTYSDTDRLGPQPVGSDVSKIGHHDRQRRSEHHPQPLPVDGHWNGRDRIVALAEAIPEDQRAGQLHPGHETQRSPDPRTSGFLKRTLDHGRGPCRDRGIIPQAHRFLP